MTTKGKLSREQAVELVGEDAVSRVEGMNCEPTNRGGYNGACQGDAYTEWSASTDAKDRDGDGVRLTIYYYTDNKQDDMMAACDGDGSMIDWRESVAGFEIV